MYNITRFTHEFEDNTVQPYFILTNKGSDDALQHIKEKFKLWGSVSTQDYTTVDEAYAEFTRFKDDYHYKEYYEFIDEINEGV